MPLNEETKSTIFAHSVILGHILVIFFFFQYFIEIRIISNDAQSIQWTN